LQPRECGCFGVQPHCVRQSAGGNCSQIDRVASLPAKLISQPPHRLPKRFSGNAARRPLRRSMLQLDDRVLAERRIIAHVVVDATARHHDFEAVLLFHAPGICLWHAHGQNKHMVRYVVSSAATRSISQRRVAMWTLRIRCCWDRGALAVLTQRLPSNFVEKRGNQ
jgi:hypothetical protein